MRRLANVMTSIDEIKQAEFENSMVGAVVHVILVSIPHIITMIGKNRALHSNFFALPGGLRQLCRSLRQGSMWDTDMTDQGARMWGELSHDEALRIVQHSDGRLIKTRDWRWKLNMGKDLLYMIYSWDTIPLFMICTYYIILHRMLQDLIAKLATWGRFAWIFVVIYQLVASENPARGISHMRLTRLVACNPLRIFSLQWPILVPQQRWR